MIVEGKTFTARVPAKLNLSLAITGKKDGLHTLDMIVCPYEKYEDVVSFCPQEGEKSGVSNVFVDCDFDGFDEQRFINAVRQKLDTVARRAGVFGSIRIRKNIPLAAGMGGSSASIVGAVKAIEQYCASIGKNMPLDAGFLLSLGGDVPYMYKGGVCRVRGFGEVVDALDCTIENEFCDIVVEGGADSGACYKTFDELGKDYANLPIPTTVQEALCVCRNDLFEASCIVNPRIKERADELKKQGIDKVFMTGSGSGLFYVV